MLYRSVRHWSLYNGYNTGGQLIRQLHQQAYKVLFFGSDHFSIPSLQALHENSNQFRPNDPLNPVAELAAVTTCKGKDNAVRKYIKTTGIPTHSWPLAGVPAELCSRFDIGIVVSFGHLIPEPIIEAFPLGMINVHASLLPRWRGAAPIIHALRSGDTVTGVTVMRVRPHHFDVGEVLAQRSVPIGPHVLMPELHTRLAQVGAEQLVQTMRTLEQSLREARTQDDSCVQYAPKVDDELAHIRWLDMGAIQVYNLYRALFSYKRLCTSWHGELVRIAEVTPPAENGLPTIAPQPPGTVHYDRATRELRVWCADGRTVGVRQLSVAGKRATTAADFNNGYLRKTHERLAVFV